DPDPSRVETWHMRYQMSLLSEEGKRYLFEGHKEIRTSGGAGHAWSETTTLYTTISEEGGTAPGTGILRLKPLDFTRMMRSIKVVGVPRQRQGEYRRAFLKLFAHEIVSIYGGALDEPGAFPSAPTIAPLGRAPKDPDGTWWCDGNRNWHADDRLGSDAFLRLTRYKAGDKGPVMLASGFGMSSHSFLTPTIEKNLTEFLASAGYDVWLFDYRAGIDLPSAGTEFTIDDIARTDWPTAVRKVQEETGRDDVQAFGHCVGSVSLQMAILAGLQGIRTAVCAQFTLHPTSSVFNMVKAQLHTADVFAALGTDSLAPDNRLSMRDEMLDIALRALPMPAEERCSQAVCRWINAVYGCTHRHAQLNEATHRHSTRCSASGTSSQWSTWRSCCARAMRSPTPAGWITSITRSAWLAPGSCSSRACTTTSSIQQGRSGPGAGSSRRTPTGTTSGRNFPATPTWTRSSATRPPSTCSRWSQISLTGARAGAACP
ncbi:MAG TPA: hypothetical protein VN714_32625, partial [Trebonia sp.]|nr:hypothetical protein [Trebonia sp.]